MRNVLLFPCTPPISAVVLSLVSVNGGGLFFGMFPGHPRRQTRPRGGPCVRRLIREHQRKARRKSQTCAGHVVRTHSFRSLLTVLGIVIGITTVVTVAVAAHRPAPRQSSGSIKEFGPDNIFIYKWTSGTPASRAAQGTQAPAHEARVCRPPSRRWSARWKTSDCEFSFRPLVDGNPITARRPASNPRTSYVAGNRQLGRVLAARLPPLAAGRFFSRRDDQHTARTSP